MSTKVGGDFHGIASNQAAKIWNRELKEQRKAAQAEQEKQDAQDELAYVRARFRADCAARAIRTSQDSDNRYLRIQVARAEVVRHKLSALIVPTDNIVYGRRKLWGGVVRQPAGGRYIGIVAQRHWSAVAVNWQ